ncbi:MAG: pitrilysin family protein [Gemmatimonadota bacterium]|nr:pitrilysin family protein [Gemmatimonadota bacterium]
MSAVDRSIRPPAGPPRPLVLPDFASPGETGPLDVRFARRHGIPEVSLRLVLEAGAGSEPAAHRGLASLAGRLLTEGTADRDAVAMARWLDRLGIGFDASVGYAVTIISMHALTDVLEEAVEFLGTVVLEPTFPEREVERVRGERLDEIDRQMDDPATVAGHAIIDALYGDGLYGRPTGGVRDTVSGITPESLRVFHERRYRPGRSVLMAAGDVEASRLADAVGGVFERWEGVAERPAPPVTPEAPRPRVILIDRPDSPQAEIRVGTIGVPYGTDDHYQIVLANAVLGGIFNSRINMNLREDKGWTYGARSGFRFRRGAGPFVAQTAVETAVTADAFGEILDEIARMQEELVPDEELELAKHALTLSLPLQFETSAHVTRRVSRQHIYDLPEDYWRGYRDRIEAVTAEEIRAVVRRRLPRERLTLLAVTDADSTESALGRFGEVERRSVEDARG